jgi:hypothetical protein
MRTRPRDPAASFRSAVKPAYEPAALRPGYASAHCEGPLRLFPSRSKTRNSAYIGAASNPRTDGARNLRDATTVLSEEPGAVVRFGEIDRRSLRHNSRRIYPFMTHVVMTLDLSLIDRVDDARHLVKIA